MSTHDQVQQGGQEECGLWFLCTIWTSLFTFTNSSLCLSTSSFKILNMSYCRLILQFSLKETEDVGRTFQEGEASCHFHQGPGRGSRGMGVRISAGARLAKNPRYTPRATLQAQLGANLSAAPAHGNQSSCLACTQPVCGPESPHECAAPFATPCSLCTAYLWPGVHRKSLLFSMCSQWALRPVSPRCTDPQCTPTSPAVTACFLPTLQSPPYTPYMLQSSPPAKSSASWWPDHSFLNGVWTPSKFLSILGVYI